MALTAQGEGRCRRRQSSWRVLRARTPARTSLRRLRKQQRNPLSVSAPRCAVAISQFVRQCFSRSPLHGRSRAMEAPAWPTAVTRSTGSCPHLMRPSVVKSRKLRLRLLSANTGLLHRSASEQSDRAHGTCGASQLLPFTDVGFGPTPSSRDAGYLLATSRWQLRCQESAALCAAHRL